MVQDERAGTGGGDVEIISGKHIELRCRPGSDLVEMRFTSHGCLATADEAAWFVAQIERIERDRQHLGWLVDCARLAKTDAGWRVTMAEYFRRPSRVRTYVAWHSASLLVRITVDMFAIATPGIKGKAFKAEPDARAWLHERGIA